MEDLCRGVGRMSGLLSRNKGARTERAIVRLLQDQGIAAEKISDMYKPGADLSVPVLGVDRAVEVKCRADGFRESLAAGDRQAESRLNRAKLLT
jgi:hypothetical protein